jgi:transketolase
MRIGIATDHGGFGLKEELVAQLRAAGHEVVDFGDFQRHGSLGNYRGRNLHFGIREHAMCAIVNGLALSGLRAFASGFLISPTMRAGPSACRR